MATFDESIKVYGEYKGPYRQKSVKKRIEALFLGNLGKVLDRELIQRAARDPKTKNKVDPFVKTFIPES